MATTRKTDETISEPEPLGAEGDTCAQCGTTLAVDQRYCLNCGTPRAEPRLDYERHLPGGAAASPPAAAAGSNMQWSPLLAIVAIAILGVMLLLGVLIGQDDTDVTVTEVPATTTAPTTAETPTETVPTAPTPTTEKTTPDAGGGAAAPGAGVTTNPQGGAAGGIKPSD